MVYHKFRFGFKKNIKVLICRIFGHRLNENPAYHWCERCGLAYEECYYPKDYFVESGILKTESDNKNKSCSKSCSPSDWEKGGKCDINRCYYE